MYRGLSVVLERVSMVERLYHEHSQNGLQSSLL
jgi:hypothetical protein